MRIFLRRAILPLLTLLISVPPPGGAAATGDRARVYSGDSAFVAMEYERARGLYLEEFARDSGDAGLLWRMARLEVCRGDIAPREEREGLYRKGEELARRAIAADSTLGAAHTWLAAALGSRAMRGSARQKVELAREIKKELDAALALDPADDGARSILGSFYRALGNISWIERALANVFLGGVPSGGFEEAELELRTAAAIAPRVFRHHFEMGLLYTDWDRPDQAIAAFERAIEVGPSMAADMHRMESAKSRIVRLRGGG